MPPNNGVIERMKAACHSLVAMEIAASGRRINNVDDYRRRRLPAIYAEFEAEWREAYSRDPSITVSQFVAMATGAQNQAQRVARNKLEANMAQVRELAATVPVDKAINTAGFAQARAALRARGDDGLRS